MLQITTAFFYICRCQCNSTETQYLKSPQKSSPKGSGAGSLLYRPIWRDNERGNFFYYQTTDLASKYRALLQAFRLSIRYSLGLLFSKFNYRYSRVTIR